LERSPNRIKGPISKERERGYTFNGMEQEMGQKREGGGEGKCCSSESLLKYALL